MSQDMQLKSLARRAYLFYHQDGLLDLLIGWIVLALGLSVVTAWSGWGLLGWLPIAFYAPLKARITIPRLGYVEFSPTPSREIMRKIVYPAAFCLFMVILLLSAEVPEGASPPAEVWTPSEVWPSLRTSLSPWLRENGAWLSGLVALIGFGVVGLAIEIRRMFVYALLGLIIMTGGQLLNLQTFILLFILAGSILSAGVVLLIRFLRKYPIVAEEEERTHATR